MRTVPEPIKLALADASLPIKKRLLLYRRKWNADTLKYALETKPIDVTDLLIEAGSIKMALDTDEVDKWDASNVTLIFNNDLNCFKEGLTGGLFENAVLWGSKVVYNIETAEKGAPTASITVFTGFVYSSPVFRDNGNRLELTVTSSLDALEYVSAESFCLTKTDELATAVTSQNSKDQGKEFATAETGVGYVDEVKYGADFESAQTLSAGNDYDLSDTNEYTKPAVVKLKFTPTVGYKMWLSYRYWHKDMAIEDIVNALLDLAGVEKRQVEKAVFNVNNGAVLYETDLQQKYSTFLFDYDEEKAIWKQKTFLNLIKNDSHPLSIGLWRKAGNGYEQTGPVRVPKKGYFHIGYPSTGTYVIAGDFSDDYAELKFLDATENGLIIRFRVQDGHRSQVLTIQDGTENLLYDGYHRAIVGFELSESALYLYTDGLTDKGTNDGGIIQRIAIPGKYDGSFTHLTVSMQGTMYNDQYNIFVARLGWREEALTETDWTNKNRVSLYQQVFNDTNGCHTFKTAGAYWNLALSEEATKWRKLEYQKSVVNNGRGEWLFHTSNDGINWTSLARIDNGMSFLSSDKFLELHYRSTSQTGYEVFEELKVSSFITSSELPFVDLTGLSVGEAVAQLAKMVAYEIGFNQDGVFFFRSRQGRYAETELTPNVLVEVDNHSADIDSLANRISVEYGQFKTIIDDFTEQKARPNSIDQYGVHEKTISNDNFIPADNVDISGAVAKANYEALSTPGYTLQAECRPDLSLELGDKITVCAENTNIAAKKWSDYNKFLKLPVWKRVFKITGLELSFAKRLMTLTLKDVTTAADVPTMEYNVYQTQFPTPLNYKE